MYKLILIGFSCLWLAACGGGGSASSSSGAAGVTLATGIFKDSNTSGLHYKSGSQEGDTGADGSFSYEVGKPVIFSLGNITLGTLSTGQSVVTPLDLFAGSSSASQTVQNLVRFLMMIDHDGDPSNGIQISAAVKSAAATWPSINFNQSTASFTSDANVVLIITSVNTVDSLVAHTLPLVSTAQSHVEATLLCARSGGFKGTYGGLDTGKFGVLVDAVTGKVEGLGFSNGASQNFRITGNTSVSFNQQALFASGVVAGPNNGGVFAGGFTSVDSMSGTWGSLALPTGGGTFTASRVGGTLNAKYRFTGKFENPALTVFGLYTFDINAANQVAGLAYNIPSDTTETLTGTVSGSSLSGTTSSGAHFSATVDLTLGTVTAATWSNSITSGTFTASGCQLN